MQFANWLDLLIESANWLAQNMYIIKVNKKSSLITIIDWRHRSLLLTVFPNTVSFNPLWKHFRWHVKRNIYHSYQNNILMMNDTCWILFFHTIHIAQFLKLTRRITKYMSYHLLITEEWRNSLVCQADIKVTILSITVSGKLTISRICFVSVTRNCIHWDYVFLNFLLIEILF
jgi:hypothetical protein